MKHRILMIEPDCGQRDILVDTFCEKFELTFAGSVEDAISINQDVCHKVIVYDIGRPDEEALQRLARLKQVDQMQTPIITIVSDNTLQAERAIRRLGISYHLVRPYGSKALEKFVEGALRVWHGRVGMHKQCHEEQTKRT